MQENIIKKVILVGFNSKEAMNFEYSMEELNNLAIACELESVLTITQNGGRPHYNSYVGKGKLEEIKEQVELLECDAVVFNDELSPSQVATIEEIVQCDILDRTLLILDIFAKRAKTKESQLQVEISKLKYQLPRLKGSFEELGRQGGGVGLSNKGVGETKLELGKRAIEAQIVKKEKELKKLVSERKTRRKLRVKTGIKTVALVGYTNAGKSTLMNGLIELTHGEKFVFAKNMLFATLETKVRRIELEDKKEFLLTDTVGFVDKLPHNLVKAFRSTLEEVKEADLLLHVIDYSNPHYKIQMRTTLDTLKEIGVEDIPIINVYNKADLIDGEIPLVHDGNINMSAKNKIGLQELIQLVSNHIFKDYVQLSLLIPYKDGSLLSTINETYQVEISENLDNGVYIEFSCPIDMSNHYTSFIYIKE